MRTADFRVLALNPGSGSTKMAVYLGEQPEFECNLRHSDGDLAPFHGRPILDQLDFRRRLIERELATAGRKTTDLDAVVGRGGLLRPVAGGTYRVNSLMLDDLRKAPRGDHASNLGAFLAHAIAGPGGVPAFVVDPVSVEEWPEIARLSGLALIERQCLSHALNTKAVARRYARNCGRDYRELRLIVAHLGSGFSISAHENGRMIDVTDPSNEGPFSSERPGGLPTRELARLCFSGRYAHREIEELLLSGGGLFSYLGTKDLADVERRIGAGDERAAMVFSAMVYQIAKEIGAMATVLRGHVSAILVTGGMAHSDRLVAALRLAIEWIGPVVVYPGEDELRALAEGALRVLRGEEPGREYGAVVSSGRE